MNFSKHIITEGDIFFRCINIIFLHKLQYIQIFLLLCVLLCTNFVIAKSNNACYFPAYNKAAKYEKDSKEYKIAQAESFYEKYIKSFESLINKPPKDYLKPREEFQNLSFEVSENYTEHPPQQIVYDAFMGELQSDYLDAFLFDNTMPTTITEETTCNNKGLCITKGYNDKKEVVFEAHCQDGVYHGKQTLRIINRKIRECEGGCKNSKNYDSNNKFKKVITNSEYSFLYTAGEINGYISPDYESVIDISIELNYKHGKLDGLQKYHYYEEFIAGGGSYIKEFYVKNGKLNGKFLAKSERTSGMGGGGHVLYGEFLSGIPRYVVLYDDYQRMGMDARLSQYNFNDAWQLDGTIIMASGNDIFYPADDKVLELQYDSNTLLYGKQWSTRAVLDENYEHDNEADYGEVMNDDNMYYGDLVSSIMSCGYDSNFSTSLKQMKRCVFELKKFYKRNLFPIFEIHNDTNGQQYEIHRTWHDNRKLKTEEYYRGKVRHGPQKEWNDKRELIRVEMYENGKRVDK